MQRHRSRSISRSALGAALAACSLWLATNPNVQADPVKSVQKLPTGVAVTFGADTLQLQALAPGVVRVLYSATSTFPPQRVPVLLPQHATPNFQVSQDPASIILTSGRLRARIDRSTGAIRFLSDSGQTVLNELAGSRSLTPVTLPGDTPVAAYQANDKFDLTQDESIYGLGQHQDGHLDHRNTTVVEEQSNREVDIPFCVSSRGYGILWNNPSHTEIAVASAAGVIPSTALLDENGNPGGLTGHYFSGINFDKEVGSQVDPKIDFVWDNTPPTGMPHDNYSVRWNGFIKADKTGDYAFQTAADDGARLWIDDKPVIDDWATHPVTRDEGVVHLEAGSRHAIRLEYFQASGGASIQLSWQEPSAPSVLSWTSEAADDIDYVVFYGPSLDTVIAEYRNATGQAPLIPKWALGYWQSKERYNTQQELLDVASEYRSRQEPIDNIVQDWFYWDPYPWGSHKFDPKRYPDPAATFQTLHDEHMHIMISVWAMFNPGTLTNPNANYNDLNAKGYLYPPAVRADSQFYDAFNPGARELYWDLMRDQLFSKGIDAWWLDASEPEVNMTELRKIDTGAGRGALVLNAFPLMHTTAVSQGQLRDAPNKRVFILTRSAYAGQQRTGAATWSGDITAGWDVFANQIPAGLNFCLSGIPYWTTDIGGFFVPYPNGSSNPEYRELYTRWFQYGAFCPLFRSHGTQAPREMWQFGPDTEKILLKYDTLRYHLMPYIYSQAWQVTHNGGTIMRALVMDFPDDATARKVQDEFMFGPSILVCPVIQEGATSRSVYLPEGTGWTNYWTGATFKGGQTITADAPIDTIPLYVKDGAVVPFGPDIQYVDQKPADPIDLKVWNGADSTFTLYEDEGDNNNYLHGAYATIPISWNDKTKTLTIGRRKGSFPGMLEHRTFNIDWVKPGQPADEANPPKKSVTYTGEAITVRQ